MIILFNIITFWILCSIELHFLYDIVSIELHLLYDIVSIHSKRFYCMLILLWYSFNRFQEILLYVDPSFIWYCEIVLYVDPSFIWAIFQEILLSVYDICFMNVYMLIHLVYNIARFHCMLIILLLFERYFKRSYYMFMIYVSWMCKVFTTYNYNKKCTVSKKKF